MQTINQRLFYALIAVYGIVILLTFSQYGITTDEPLHVVYGENIWRWYTSFFRDQTVFFESNLWLYGGLFDTVIQVLRQVVPMDVYELRHLVCAFVGLLGVVAAYKIGTVLGDYRTGVLAAFFLILTPRYYGHAFNNSKDIPFAVAYLWSLYYLIRGMGALPFLSRSLIWKMGLALGCTLGVRASGAVLLGYMGLFWGVRYVQLVRGADGLWRVMLFRVCGIGLVAYFALFPFFPWLHTHPITGLWDSFRAFASFPEVHYIFFEGAYLASNAIPWYYVSKWLLLTLPEFVVPGLCVGLVVVLLGLRREWLDNLQVLQHLLVVFAVLFPLVYGALAESHKAAVLPSPEPHATPHQAQCGDAQTRYCPNNSRLLREPEKAQTVYHRSYNAHFCTNCQSQFCDQTLTLGLLSNATLVYARDSNNPSHNVWKHSQHRQQTSD